MTDARDDDDRPVVEPAAAGAPTSSNPPTSSASSDPSITTVTRPGRRARAMGALAILVVAALAFVAIRDRRQLDAEVTRLQAKLDEARGDAGEQIADLEVRIEELEAELAATTENLDAAESRLRSVSEELAGTEATLAERTAELAAERELATELRAELDAIGAVIAPMPELLGASLDEAEAFADELDAVLIVDRVAPPNVLARPGTIIGQQPDVGVIIVPGALIRIELYEPGTEPGD